MECFFFINKEINLSMGFLTDNNDGEDVADI